MPAGLTVYNDGNIIQIDENFRCQKLAYYNSYSAKPTGGSIDLAGADMRTECPLIFARTSGWIGGFKIDNYNYDTNTNAPQGSLFLFASASFELTVFSGLLANFGGTSGLEVYDQNGNLVYSSNAKYPRIHTIAALNGSLTSQSIGIPDKGVLPWICLNPLVPSLSKPLGSGSDTSYPPFIHMAQYNNNTLNHRLIDNGAATGALATNAQKSPYYNKTLRIPIALIPGY